MKCHGNQHQKVTYRGLNQMQRRVFQMQTFIILRIRVNLGTSILNPVIFQKLDQYPHRERQQSVNRQMIFGCYHHTLEQKYDSFVVSVKVHCHTVSSVASVTPVTPVSCVC